ncbi:uncharacterized protein LOC115984741 [Quercus lobata]|uniref:uncharacterized protein LOC115984741 n=1 Tax=Quercus lobata TaxID=97700 RepID=UPI0012491B60|nr:uncharacterized protein LOC115984741 [Quercus lobata]
MNESGDNNNSSEQPEEVPNVQQSRQGPNQDAQRFYSLLKDADQHLYEGCKNFSKLSAIILKDMLPLDAKLPKDTYEAKKIIKDLGLGYEKIDACINDCMLFWKENANDEECKVYHTSRWATNENDKKNSGNDKENNGKDFSSDPRNVRLGLAVDRFNLFGNMSTSHSTWPVILIPYNLPPWMCMKRSSFMLSLLIPGPSSPLNDIDVYLQPLIEELKELWDDGISTYDVSSNENFKMHAVLMWMINDFPAYGDLSGWSTKGAFACPSCNLNTRSQWLKYGGKYCYMGHRRFLEEDHRFRKDRNFFDGTDEMEKAPIIPSGIDIMVQTEGINCIFGKKKTKVQKRKRKRKEDVDQEPKGWKKRSIFFELPYWENHMLRHNLDVMHIEKNVIDNVLGTVLELPRKTKDNLKARLDLKDMGIRHTLHPEKRGDDKTYMPRSCFTMVPKEKDSFLRVLKKIRVPDGYASNISRCIQRKQRKIFGLKSHDSHIIMQQLLPIAIRGALPKKVSMALIDLSCYFREVCSKVLQVEDLEKLESRIAMTLCELEKIFPPFFTVLVHLVIHLATEAKIAGPVHYRWMYPIERLHKERIKSRKRPRRVPEGVINKIHIEEFCDWFRTYVVAMSNTEKVKLTNKVIWLAEGPNTEARRMKRYVVNGTKFQTKDYEENKKTQNSGRMTNDPFILASQTSQVYYVEDERDKDWLVVDKTKPRDVFDVRNGNLSDNDVDIYCDNEPYDTVTENPPNNVNDDLNWARNNVDGTIVDTSLPLDEENFMDDSESEEDY